MRGAAAHHHHLFRLRITRATWDKLRSIAADETDRLHQLVSASDLARAAIHDWIGMHEEASRLGALRPPGVAAEASSATS